MSNQRDEDRLSTLMNYLIDSQRISKVLCSFIAHTVSHQLQRVKCLGSIIEITNRLCAISSDSLDWLWVHQPSVLLLRHSHCYDEVREFERSTDNQRADDEVSIDMLMITWLILRASAKYSAPLASIWFPMSCRVWSVWTRLVECRQDSGGCQQTHPIDFEHISQISSSFRA